MEAGDVSGMAAVGPFPSVFFLPALAVPTVHPSSLPPPFFFSTTSDALDSLHDTRRNPHTHHSMAPQRYPTETHLTVCLPLHPFSIVYLFCTSCSATGRRQCERPPSSAPLHDVQALAPLNICLSHESPSNRGDVWWRIHSNV